MAKIIRGKAVVCGISNQGTADCIEDAGVLVEDGVVRRVDPFDTLTAANPDAEVVGSGADVILPGFVNAHHHVGLTPFQLGVPDLPLELWIAAKIGARAINPYLDTLYSAFEMVASGVTTVQHLHVSRAAPADVSAQAEAVLNAYADIGMRVSYSFAYRDQNRLAYESDESVLARVPAEFAEDLRAWFEAQHMSLSAYLTEFKRLHAHYAGRPDGRVAVQLAPANLHWCSDEALAEIARTSRQCGAPMHLHLLETIHQKNYAYRRSGRSAVAHLHALGVLGPLTTLGHMVWAEADDLDLIAATGTCICHNASSNLRLGSGIAPCQSFLARQIPVAIGIDEAGLNDDRDMLQELRLVMHLHRQARVSEPGLLSAAKVFQMATEYGASTTAFRGRIGKIAPGMAADMVLFDWRSIAAPHIDRDVSLLDAILHRGKRNAVRAVIVAGETIYEGGRFLRVDRDAVLAEIESALSRPVTASEERRKTMARSVTSCLRAAYDNA